MTNLPKYKFEGGGFFRNANKALVIMIETMKAQTTWLAGDCRSNRNGCSYLTVNLALVLVALP